MALHAFAYAKDGAAFPKPVMHLRIHFASEGQRPGDKRASQADYAGLRVLDPIYVQQELSAPHTWHAAEALLYLLSSGKVPLPPAP